VGISGNKGKSLGNKLNGMQLFCVSPSVCTTDRFDKDIKWVFAHRYLDIWFSLKQISYWSTVMEVTHTETNRRNSAMYRRMSK
jgi:hypothetical protein